MIATQPGSFGRIRRAYPAPNAVAGSANRMAERIRAVASFHGWMPMNDCPEPRDLKTSAEARRKAADLMLADPVVKAGFLQKVLGVAQLDVSVTPDDAKIATDRDAAEFCQYAVTRRLSGGVRGFVESVLTALLPEGNVLCEPVWRTQANGSPELESRGRWKGKRILKAIKPKPPDSYELQVDDYRNVTAVRCPGPNNTKIDYRPKQFIILSYLPQYNDPQGWNDLEAAYKAFLIKQDATRLRSISQSNFAGPFLVAKSDDPTSATLKTALYEARGCGFITLGANDDVQVLSLAGADDDQFARGIQDCDRQILIGIVGAYLHILEGQVADAAGNTREHRGIAELFQWHLAALIGSVLTEQLGPILVDENFAGAGYPLWKLEGIDPQDQKERLELGAMLAQNRVPTSKKQWYETSGWRPPEDEADTLAPPEVAPAPAGGGFPFAEPPADTFDETTGKPLPKLAGPPASDEVALAGPDGRDAARLLRAAKAEGVRVFGELTEQAAMRLLKAGKQTAAKARKLFNDDELMQLSDTLAAVNGTAELLGRARIRLRQKQAEAKRVFAEDRTDFSKFDEAPPKPLPPNQALDFFRSLVPELGVDPVRFGPLMERRAFTLAAATDEILLQKVKGAIAQGFELGGSLTDTTQKVQELLDNAGVTVRNPQYAEMVARTNMNSSYVTGSQRELAEPDVQEAFPVYKYIGIRDGRQGKDHEPHFDTYHLSSQLFTDVRGERVWNCRCNFIPIDQGEWNDLQARGVRVSG